MILGFSRNTETNALCIAKQYNDSVVTAHLLTCTGTVPVKDAAMKDCDIHAMQSTALALMKISDEVASGNGVADLRYAAARLSDTMQIQDEYCVTLGDALGQRFYLCGCSVYTGANKFLVIPYGSGALYTFLDGKLRRKGYEKIRVQMPAADSKFDGEEEQNLAVGKATQEALEQEKRFQKYIRNTIGGIGVWTPKIYECVKRPHMHLIVTSHPLPDLEKAAQIIGQNDHDTAHPDTVSILLRQELDTIAQGGPTAVMEITL